MYCTIKRGGDLILTLWDSGQAKEREAKEILRFLHWECNLEENLKLEDILLFLRKYKDELEPIFKTEAFVNEGLDNPAGERKQIEELRVGYKLEEWEGEMSGLSMPEFHGVDSLGETYALDFSPVYNLKDLPIALDKSLKLFGKKDDKWGYILESKADSMNLFQILSSITWELSFHGNPEERDSVFKEIKEQADKLSIPDTYRKLEEMIANLTEEQKDMPVTIDTKDGKRKAQLLYAWTGEGITVPVICPVQEKEKREEK